MRAVVTGATGYVGSRLIPVLLEQGWEVVAAGRDAKKLQQFPWADDVALVEVDVLDAASVAAAFADRGQIDVAYYLVHAIGEGDFAAKDEQSAAIFAEQAARAHVGRIVYLGGFVPAKEDLSEHLASRGQVGSTLTAGEVDVVWLRAAVVIGAGSTSYELIRALADRLPVVPIPPWLNHDVEPIAVNDVLHYLAAAGRPELPPGHYNITGPDTLSYRELIRQYIRAAGLRRLLVPTPLVSTGVAGWVIGRITPLPPALAQDLVDSMHNTMTSEEDRIRDLVPAPPPGLTSVASAMRRAQPRPDDVADDLPTVQSAPDPLQLVDTDPVWAGGRRYETHRRRQVAAAPAAVWAVIETLGGTANGFFSWPLAWKIRGFLDKRAGGPGMAQHRANPGRLTVGDTISFLTVTGVSDRHLQMATDQWAPGAGSLELWTEPIAGSAGAGAADVSSTVHLRARWIPQGVLGRLYWIVLRPFHGIIFPTILRRISNLAVQRGAE